MLIESPIANPSAQLWSQERFAHSVCTNRFLSPEISRGFFLWAANRHKKKKTYKTMLWSRKASCFVVYMVFVSHEQIFLSAYTKGPLHINVLLYSLFFFFPMVPREEHNFVASGHSNRKYFYIYFLGCRRIVHIKLTIKTSHADR